MSVHVFKVFQQFVTLFVQYSEMEEENCHRVIA